MMPAVKELKAVSPQPGQPLYMAARDAVRTAIDAGVFIPGQQMPSTKELSEQLAVSLVTAHRALQELVASGVLQRSQGKGTFVHQRYFDRKAIDTRIGLVFHREASIGDYYHGQIFEGVRQAAQELSTDLILLRFGEDVRNECNGYLFVNPLPDELEQFGGDSNRKQPVLVVGAKSHLKKVCSFDVDNVDLARQAVAHLCDLGHTRIGYVGGDDQISNSRDRWRGFVDACAEFGVTPGDAHVVKGSGWRLSENERLELIRALSAKSRPTAIFAGGYYFALDVYAAAGAAGLAIPDDLSVVGVDDPPSAAHLSPPLTTLRQPLVQLGHAAVTALYERIRPNAPAIESRELRAELIVRRSTGRAATEPAEHTPAFMPHREIKTDILIVGGGTGGVAAALAIAREGGTCVMTEPTDWVGGQLTSQAVPPDENRWIEGDENVQSATASYLELRELVRTWYRQNRPLTDAARGDERLNPGNGWVSHLCFEPAVGHAVLQSLLAPHAAGGAIKVLYHHEPIAAD